MFPIIAIGAALFGAYAIKEAVDPPEDSGATHGHAGAGTRAQQDRAPLPQQSYLVTPMNGSQQSANQPLSAVDAVRNFVF